MRDRGARSWRTIGCTALLSAAVAFPAGWLLSGRAGDAVRPDERPSRSTPVRSVGNGGVRNMYTASPLSDPVVVQQHLRVVEAMERGCRLLGEGCAEAEQARRDIDRRLAAD